MGQGQKVADETGSAKISQCNIDRLVFDGKQSGLTTINCKSLEW